MTVTGTVNVPNTEFYVDYTNKYEETEVTITKVWDDANDQDGIRPETISMQLKAGDTNKGDPVTLPINGAWSYTWEHLPKYAAGVEIVYTADETAVPDGYDKTVTGTQAEGFTVTNKHVPEVVNIPVQKIWDDNNNEFALRTTSISVQLKADGENKGNPVTLNAGNQWKYTWENQPKNAAGRKLNTP